MNPFNADSLSEFNVLINREYFKASSCVLFPLIDMVNHLHPTKSDRSDLVSFNFEIFGLANEPESEKRTLGITAKTKYNKNEEFSYCY